MRKAFLPIGMVAVMALAACAPAVITPAPTDTQAGTDASQLTPTPPNEESPVSSGTALPVLPLPVKEEATFTITGQMGGTVSAVAMDGNTIYLGVGPRLLTVDITDPASPRFLWQSDILSGMVGAIALQAGLAYVGTGHEFYIFNMIDPANSVPVSALNAFDKSEQVSWLEIFLEGNIAYTMSFVNYFSSRRLVAFEVSDSTQPTVVATRELPQGSAITVSRNVLYIAAGGGEFFNSNVGVLQLVDPANLDRTISEIALDGAWSYQVVVSGDIAYIIENRLSEDPDVLLVLDVSDPAQPREVTRQQMTILKSMNGIVATDEALILLGHSWPEGICPALLYVIDVTDPALPGEPVEYDPQSCIGRLTLAGDTLTAIDDHELQVFNVSDPKNVTLTGRFAPPTVIKDVQGIALNQGLAYIHSTAGGARLHVLDMTGSSPVLLSEVSDMGPHYDIGFQGLHIRGAVLFMQIQAGMIGFDIRQATAPRRITHEYFSTDNWTAPAEAGNILYKAASNGLEIVDSSDPDNPIVAETLSLEGFLPTSLSATQGKLLVFSQNVEKPEERRLQIFDIRDPIEPGEVGRFSPGFDIGSFTVVGDMIYAAVSEGEEHTLYLLDISDPAHPAEVGRFALPKAAGGLTASGDLLYMMMTDMYSNEIWALNIRDRSHPYLAGLYPPQYLTGWHYPLPAGDFIVDGDQIYLAAGNAGLYILKVNE